MLDIDSLIVDIILSGSILTKLLSNVLYVACSHFQERCQRYQLFFKFDRTIHSMFLFFCHSFFLKKRIYLVVNIKQNLFSTCLLLKVTKKQLLFYVIPRAHDNTRSRAKSATYIGITYIQNTF